MVIDWENGRGESVPGWDLVHYFYFQAVLVEKLSPAKALEQVRSVLNERSCFVSYLKQCGWGTNSALLLKSYFYSMKDQLENYELLAKQV